MLCFCHGILHGFRYIVHHWSEKCSEICDGLVRRSTIDADGNETHYNISCNPCKSGALVVPTNLTNESTAFTIRTREARKRKRFKRSQDRQAHTWDCFLSWNSVGVTTECNRHLQTDEKVNTCAFFNTSVVIQHLFPSAPSGFVWEVPKCAQFLNRIVANALEFDAIIPSCEQRSSCWADSTSRKQRIGARMFLDVTAGYPCCEKRWLAYDLRINSGCFRVSDELVNCSQASLECQKMNSSAAVPSFASFQPQSLLFALKEIQRRKDRNGQSSSSGVKLWTSTHVMVMLSGSASLSEEPSNLALVEWNGSLKKWTKVNFLANTIGIPLCWKKKKMKQWFKLNWMFFHVKEIFLNGIDT